MISRRPRLAYPFTVLAHPDIVRLVAGEDYRYTLTGDGLEQWLPALLARCDGGTRVDQLLAELSPDQRGQAVALLDRLYGERVLVDGPAEAAHVPRASVRVCRQDTLDFAAAMAAQREARRDHVAFLWASHGAMSRAYVSPLFLPDAGPCLGCLLGAFRRLSPAPELYDALLDHPGPFTPAPFPEEGLAVMQALIEWKLRHAATDHPPAALYRLHVLELERMEVSAERVFLDPQCPECGGGAR